MNILPKQKRNLTPVVMGNDEIRSLLEERLGRVHAQQRLGIESEHEAQIFGQGLNFFHFENLTASKLLIRAFLMATGLYWRGLKNAKTSARHAQHHQVVEAAHVISGLYRCCRSAIRTWT